MEAIKWNHVCLVLSDTEHAFNMKCRQGQIQGRAPRVLEQSLCSMHSGSAYENKLFWARWITNRKLRTETKETMNGRVFYWITQLPLFTIQGSVYIQLDVVTNSSN